MLKALKINNIVLIESLEIDFAHGLTVLTGETGAGKSIIFDSLNFVLGARSDKNLIRNGEKTAKVDALFDISNISNDEFKTLLFNMGIDFDDEILISRKMSIDGKNEIRINGNMITSTMLKQLTSYLVDIYGQQEQVSLLKPSKQLELLDGFAGKELKELKNTYQQNFKKYKQVKSTIQAFGGDQTLVEREKDYLKFVIKEIEQENLSSDEEKELEAKKQKLNNMEKIATGLQEANQLLSNIQHSLSQSNIALSGVTKYDESLSSLADRLKSSKWEIDDIADTLSSYDTSLYSEKDFEAIDKRLDRYKELKRKYGSTCEDILVHLNECKQKLESLENSEQNRLNLENEKEQLIKVLFDDSLKINKIRKDYSEIFANKLLENLSNLGMPNAKVSFEFFDLDLIESNLTSHGVGQVEMYFSSNLGMEIKPLNKVVSGGEMSRLMLAIKAIVAQNDDMPTMIFDEIDTGISGQMAQAVGEKMAQIAKFHQVIAITHSVQIASIADSHYLIKKMETNGKTISTTTLLSYDERIYELARFISGDNVTEQSKLSAKELLNSQDKLKTVI